MKKLLGILVLGLLFSGNANAGIEDVGYGKICPTVKQGYEEAMKKCTEKNEEGCYVHYVNNVAFGQ